MTTLWIAVRTRRGGSTNDTPLRHAARPAAGSWGWGPTACGISSNGAPWPIHRTDGEQLGATVRLRNQRLVEVPVFDPAHERACDRCRHVVLAIAEREQATR